MSSPQPARLRFNWQANQIVYGLEGDISLSGSDSIDWLASVRGRLGYLTSPICWSTAPQVWA
jgi:hypothetical protein